MPRSPNHNPDKDDEPPHYKLLGVGVVILQGLWLAGCPSRTLHVNDRMCFSHSGLSCILHALRRL